MYNKSILKQESTKQAEIRVKKAAPGHLQEPWRSFLTQDHVYLNVPRSSCKDMSAGTIIVLLRESSALVLELHLQQT